VRYGNLLGGRSVRGRRRMVEIPASLIT
jgi:hypothetical protein